MSITLSAEQNVYLQTFGRVVLNACPGSGKTTAVAHKLHHLIQNGTRVLPQNAGIACLSFTNVAKNEIAEKFREISGFSLSYPHLISTIDSFINTYITLPFAHKFNFIVKRCRIVDDIVFLRRFLLSIFELRNSFGQLLHRFDPCLIEFTVTNGIVWDGHDKSKDSKFVEYGNAVKKLQFSSGLLKTSDSAFLAYNILKNFPRLAKYLSRRFQYLIIDEAQDTSEIQHSIFEILCNEGLKYIDLVGDPYQCLYQWRNASPELFFQKFEDKTNWKGIYLSENRRSNKKIIDVFNVLRRKNDKDIVPINNSPEDLPIHIIKYDDSDYNQAIANYERICIDSGFTSNGILVRGNTLKNRLIGKESDYSPWKSSIPYKLIEAKIHLLSNEIKEAINKCRRVVIELQQPGILFDSLKDRESELKNDKDLNAHFLSVLRELPSFDFPITEWTDKTQSFLQSSLHLTKIPDFIIKKINSQNFNKASLTNPMNNYFGKYVSNNNIPIFTIHQVKGMTFDSVFLILSGNSVGQNISLKEFTRPSDLPTEKQRMIYVASSRPRSLLCIGVQESESDINLRKIFGDEIIIL